MPFWLGSDFDILESGDCKDITRAPALGINGSGIVKVGEKALLNFWARSRVSSICCFWSSPTGTRSALYIRMSLAIKTG